MVEHVFVDVTDKKLDDIIAQYNDTVKRLRQVPPGRWTNEQRRRQIEIARMSVDGTQSMKVAKMQHKFVQMDMLLVDLTQR